MADIDLKTLTPDTTINDSAILFGADSQASASPSVYAVSTVRQHIVGTANTFTQPQIVSVSSSSDALRVTQTGAGNAILVEDTTNPDATPFVVDASGNVTIGSATQTTGSGYTPKVQLLGTSNSLTAIGQYSFSASGSSPINEYALSRSGTIGTHTVVQDGDTVGSLRFSGSDGTGFIRAAQIVGQVDGTPGTNDMPGRLIFSTTADGASAPSERMRITSAGRVSVGTTTPNAAALLDLTSTTSGFLPPRMTTAQRDLISTPPNGLVLYNSTTDKLQVRAAGAWVDLH
jgi:hypothetical protein